MATPLRVLVVEDSEDDAQLLLRQLRGGGYAPAWERVDTAEAMAAALAKATWDVIVCDYSLPRFDALAALALAQRSGLDLPFIVVSGKIGEETAVDTMKAGAHDYVMKDRLHRLPAAVARELRDAKNRHDQRDTEGDLRRHVRTLQVLHDYAARLGTLSQHESVDRYAATTVREYAGATLVLFGRYLPEQRMAETAYIAADDSTLAAITAILHRDLIGSRLELPAAIYQRIVAARVEIFADVHEASFGTVPKEASDELARSLGLGQVIGMPLVHQGQLWGALTAVLPAGAALPDLHTLGTLAEMSAQAIARRETQERFQVSFERSSVGKSLISCDGCLLRVNDAFAAMLGYTREEIEGRSFDEFTFAEDKRKGREVLGHLLGGADARRLEKRYVRKDGSLVWADANLAAVRNASGQAQYFIASDVDITERKRSQEALAQSEENFRLLTERSAVGVYVVQDGLIVYANPRLAQVFGYPPHEMAGKVRPADLIHPGDLPFIMQAMDELMTERADDQNRVYRGMKRDGSPIYIEVYGTMARFGGRPAILGTLLEVTERVRAQEALVASEGLVRGILDNMLDAYLRVDVDGRITMVSPSAVQLYGYGDMAEMLGLPRALLYASNEERDCMLADLVQQGKLRDRIGQGRRKDGTLFWASVNARLLRDEQGREAGAECFVRDISERKRADQEREKLEEQLRISMKMDAIGRLAGGVAHDFNNLLSVILSYTEFALERTPPGDVRRNDLAEVAKAADSAVALTRQLLAFSRKQALQPVPLSLNHVIAGMERMLRRILGEDITVVQALAPDLGLTLADPGQIEQVVMNLVVNARDAMLDGGTLTIATANVEGEGGLPASLGGDEPKAFVELRLSDTGCGMDEATQARLFEPFFTTKEKGKGTGLGLSTIFGFVKQSGGDIQVTSRPGYGSTFRIFLPRVAAVATPTPHPMVTAALATGHETILVVDDEEALREAARRSLVHAGYQVVVAGDGRAALHAWEELGGRVDLVLTDVIMPEMSGKGLAAELAQRAPGTKILFMSGYTDDTIAHHGVLDPGIHFIAKPFTAVSLAQKVRAVLDLAGPPADAAPTVATVATALTSADRTVLAALPAEIRTRLHKAATAACAAELGAILEVIGLTAPHLAAGLQGLVDRSDYDGIVALVR